jgi:hypothetical protein
MATDGTAYLEMAKMPPRELIQELTAIKARINQEIPQMQAELTNLRFKINEFSNRLNAKQNLMMQIDDFFRENQ